MGRNTSGVKGMKVGERDNWVLAMDVAGDTHELLVLTENGYGKRTALSDYPRKGRGTMGVKTIELTATKGGLAGALVVREHEELVFISAGGMVQRTGVRGINRYGRAAQGVRLMNLREDDTVSAVALVAESSEPAITDRSRDPAPDRRPTRRNRRPRPARAQPKRPSLSAAHGARVFRTRLRYSGDTRERRWSLRWLTVLAGLWRWPAVRSEKSAGPA